MKTRPVHPRTLPAWRVRGRWLRHDPEQRRARRSWRPYVRGSTRLASHRLPAGRRGDSTTTWAWWWCADSRNRAQGNERIAGRDEHRVPHRDRGADRRRFAGSGSVRGAPRVTHPQPGIMFEEEFACRGHGALGRSDAAEPFGGPLLIEVAKAIPPADEIPEPAGGAASSDPTAPRDRRPSTARDTSGPRADGRVDHPDTQAMRAAAVAASRSRTNGEFGSRSWSTTARSFSRARNLRVRIVTGETPKTSASSSLESPSQ